MRERGGEKERERCSWLHNFLVFLAEMSNKSQLAPSYYWKRGRGKGRLLDESVSQKQSSAWAEWARLGRLCCWESHLSSGGLGYQGLFHNNSTQNIYNAE